jgi:DNA-directed RNA polymerase specialized sigma subunit
MAVPSTQEITQLLVAWNNGDAAALEHPNNRRVEIEELSKLAAPSVHREEDDDLWLASLKECLSNLPEEDRELIIEYYQEDKQAKIDSRKALAARLGISPNVLFSRAKRIRDRLERSVTNTIACRSMRTG